MNKTYLFAVPLAFLLSANTWAQAQSQLEQKSELRTLSDGTRLESTAKFSLVADPCKKASKLYTMQVNSSSLDSGFVLKPWPPGIEVQTVNALGIASITAPNLSNDTFQFTLEAQADGTLIEQSSNGKKYEVCVGGNTAFIEVAVIAHYKKPEANVVSYKSPKPDIRLALDFSLLKRAAAGFDHYKLGEWIRLGEFPYFCGDRSYFDVIVKDPPLLTASGYLNVSGDYGTTLALGANIRAEIDSGCLGNPQANAAATAGVTIGLFGGGSLPVTGNANINFGGIFNRNFPFTLNVPVPAISSIPVDLPPVQGTTLEFGTFNGSIFTPSQTPTHKDVPITVNLGSFGGASTDNGALIIDGTIGQPRVVDLSTQNEAMSFFTSDLPLWGQTNLGVTVHDSFLGAAASNQSGSGLLGALLPIRVKGSTIGSFRKSFEIVFDGAAATFVKHEGADAISIELSSSYAQIGHGPPIVGHGKPIKKIKASVLLDRIVADNGVLKFRVADFRIKISTWFFVIPIKLSSGQLQASLNNGQIPLTSNLSFEIDLPECVYTGFDKFISPPNTCNAQPLIGYLGYWTGPRTAVFTIDPSTLISRFNQFQVGSQKWQGFQASVQVKLTQ